MQAITSQGQSGVGDEDAFLRREIGVHEATLQTETVRERVLYSEPDPDGEGVMGIGDLFGRN